MGVTIYRRAEALDLISKINLTRGSVIEKAYIGKAYIGMGMEGYIARWYEKNTRRELRLDEALQSS
jgi:hypothetical protein